MAKKQKAIRAYELPLTTRAAVLGELRLRAALPLEPDVTKAVATIRKDDLYSVQLTAALRFIARDFVRQHSWRLEQLDIVQLQIWLDLRRAWVERIAPSGYSSDYSFGTRTLPASVVALFGFRPEHGNADEIASYTCSNTAWSFEACVQNAITTLSA